MIAGQRQNEVLFRRYLLGQASEEEQRAIERDLLADQEYFDQFLRCEEELIDEYACGAMIGADKECFERHFMVSPERRESVAFAQAMHRYFLEQKRHRAESWGLSPAWAMRMNVALMVAVIVLVSVSGLLLRTTLQLRRLVEQNRVELSQAEQREKMLTQQIAGLTSLVQELTKVESPTHKDDSDLASLVLKPGLSRAGDPSATLYLSPNIHRLRLVLKIEGETHRSYRAEVQTVEGEAVRSYDDLKAKRTGSNWIVEIVLPAAIVTRSDYLVILSGTTSSGDSDKIGTYHFSVIRK